MKPNMPGHWYLVIVDAVEEDENTSRASTKNRSANRSKNL
jgi:hypothetical protein